MPLAAYDVGRMTYNIYTMYGDGRIPGYGKASCPLLRIPAASRTFILSSSSIASTMAVAAMVARSDASCAIGSRSLIASFEPYNKRACTKVSACPDVSTAVADAMTEHDHAWVNPPVPAPPRRGAVHIPACLGWSYQRRGQGAAPRMDRGRARRPGGGRSASRGPSR